ncbi:MAG: hypothetical protein ABJE95_10285 [Byssovorax sp.]
MRILTTPRALLFFLLAGGAAVAAGACGYPTFGFVSDGTSTTGGVVTGGGGASTSSSVAGTGGGDAATSSADSSAASASGTGGGGPVCAITHKGKGTCEYLPGHECGCPDVTTKCAVIDETTGESDCIPIGASPTAAWSGCDTDNDCAAKTWCDLDLHVCKPICSITADCSAGAHCVPVLQSKVNTPIPSLKACTAHCDPQSAAPCGVGLTCLQDSNSEFDCARSKKTVLGAMCTYADDCDKGLLCIGSGAMFTCEKWCHPADAFGGGCPFDKLFCSSFATAVTYNSSTYGFCVAP